MSLRLFGSGVARTSTAGTSRHVLLLRLLPLLNAQQACEPGCWRKGEQSALRVMPQAHSQEKHGWEDAGRQCIRQPASWAIGVLEHELYLADSRLVASVRSPWRPISPAWCMTAGSAMQIQLICCCSRTWLLACS